MSIRMFKTRPRCLKNRFVRDSRGAVAIVTALGMVSLIGAVGFAIDAARLHAAKGEYQNDCDAALLAAAKRVKPGDSIDTMKTDMQAFFNANLPDGYMGGSYDNFRLQQNDNGDYIASFDARVPLTLMTVMGLHDKTLQVECKAISAKTSINNVEVALVVDNSNSMDEEGKIQGLKTAATTMINLLYDEGTTETKENLSISVIPYDRAVNIGYTGSTDPRRNWIKSSQRAAFRGTAEARDPDNYGPVIPSVRYDYLPNPPLITDQNYLFNKGYNTLPGKLQPILFASQNRTATLATISGMAPAGETRINIGAMWGFYSLVHQWQGIWDSGKPTFPRTPGPRNLKYMVLLTDGLNTIRTGGTYCNKSHIEKATCKFDTIKAKPKTVRDCCKTVDLCTIVDKIKECPDPPTKTVCDTPESDGKCYTYYSDTYKCRKDDPFVGCTCNDKYVCDETGYYANDNESLKGICDAAKAYGIQIITIGLGNTINESILKYCASTTDKLLYYKAPKASDLEPIFQDIADQIGKSLNLRLI